MRLVKILGAAIVAVLAFSAIAAVGASAHEFEASVVPTLLLAKQEGPQVFKTLAGTLECLTLTGHGIAVAPVSTTQKVTVSYKNCVANNGKLTAKPDEPINAEYEFNANGTVKVLKSIPILATLGGLKCTITVKAQGPLSTITYANKGTKEILIGANVTGIETSAVGAGCLEAYSSSATGTYVGNSITEADGSGTIAWK